jgi:HSP20 family protein
VAKRYPTISLFSRLQGELNRLLEEFRDFGETSLEGGEWRPRVDVVEMDEAIVILAEVPGVAARDLNLEVAGSVVTLSGTRGAFSCCNQ